MSMAEQEVSDRYEGPKMKKFVEIEKQSKKAQKAFYNRLRKTWGNLKPTERIIPNKKKEAKDTGEYKSKDHDE